MARFLSTIRDAQDRELAVAIYTEGDDYQSFEVGFVEHADASETVLLCVTPKGEPDGRRVLRTQEIVRVDSDNAYVRKLTLLYQYRDMVFDKDFRPVPIKTGSDLISQLRHAFESNTIVNLVDTNDYGPSGFIRNLGEDYVELERISPNGEPDGLSTMLISSITKVHLGRRQDQVLAFLYRYNYELKRLLQD